MHYKLLFHVALCKNYLSSPCIYDSILNSRSTLINSSFKNIYVRPYLELATIKTGRIYFLANKFSLTELKCVINKSTKTYEIRPLKHRENSSSMYINWKCDTYIPNDEDNSSWRKSDFTFRLETYFTNHTDLLTPYIRAALVNSHSIRNKIPMSIEILIDFNIDILIITETCLSHKDCTLLSSLNIDPYSFTHLPRSLGTRGGGLGIVYKSSLTYLNMLPTTDAQTLHNSLLHILDIHAPILNKTTILRLNTSWCTITFHVKNDVYESKSKKEKSSSSLTTYKNLKNKHRIYLINAKAMFTHDKFISMQHNSKSLFKLANSILGRRKKSPYSEFTNDELPNLFDSFFNEKITNFINTNIG